MELIKKNLGKVAITCNGKWDINKSYDKLSLVYDNKTNTSYISKQDVPIGINIDNVTYWQKFQLNNGSSPVEGEGIDNVYLLPFDGVNKSGTLTVKELDEIKDAIDSNKIIILKYYDKDYESYEYYLYDTIYKNNFDIILKHSYINGDLLTIYDCIIDPLGKTYKLNSNNFNINNIYILPYNLYDYDEKEFNINNDEFNKLQVAISENKLILAKINKNSNSYIIPNISVIEDHININYKSINYTYDGAYYELTIYVETLSCERNYLDLSFQKKLESGKDVKTINRQSILGKGDVTIVLDLEYIGLSVNIDSTQTISGATLSRLTEAIQKNTIFKCEYNNEILYCNSTQQVDNNIYINFILNSENNILHKLTLEVYVNAGAYRWILEPIFEQEETIQNVYSLDVTSRSFNINKTEVEKLYNHLVNNGIVICKLSDSEKFIPTNIHYDNMDVYSISLSKGLDILNPNGRYVNIVISTSDGENYTCDTYTGDDSDYPYCLLTYATNDTITNDKFNEIYYKINSGRTPKYINEHGSIIMFNVDEVTDSRIELSTPILNSEFLYYSISIYKDSENDNYIFSFAETNN